MRLPVVVLCLFALLFAAALPTLAQENADAIKIMKPTHRLTVAGHGQVRIKPDKVDITIGVVTEDRSSQTAARNNAARSQAVQAALRKAGIATRDIQTINYTVEPIYTSPPSNRGGAPQITGYRVYNQVRVTVRKLDAMGDILDAVTAVGSNNIENIALGAEDQKAAVDEALTQAVADARRKADRLAKAAGTTIDGVYEINENGAENGGPRPMAFARQEAATPIAPGELTITANVTVVYSITGQLTNH